MNKNVSSHHVMRKFQVITSIVYEIMLNYPT